MRFLLVLVLCLLPFAAAAQDDRDRLTAFLEDSLSGAGRTVTVTGFRGALSSRATVDRLTIADDAGVWLTLTNVVLDWNRVAVLRGNIEINALTADEVTLDRLPQTSATPSPEAKGFALPDLPVGVRIGRIAAGRVTLGASVLGQPVAGTLTAALTLSGGEGQGNLTIERQDDGPDGRIALNASYSNASGQLVLALDATEAAGGIAATLLNIPGAPALRLTVDGVGPLSAFVARTRLETDGAERLTGQVSLSEPNPGERRFAAEVSGDLAPLFLPLYAGFFGPEVQLAAEGTRGPTGRLDLTRLNVSARALTLDGALTIAADGLPERAQLTGRLADPTGAPVLLPLPGNPTRVQGADLALFFDASQGEGWKASATLNGLSRPDLTADRFTLTGSGRIAHKAGGNAGRALGGTFTYAAEGLAPTDPALAAALGPRIAGKATLYGAPAGDALTIARMTLAGADYALTASGRVEGLTSGFRVNGRAELTAAELTRFAALAGRPLSGAATLAISGGGSPLGGDFDVTLRATGTDLAIGQPQADNLLRGPSQVDASVLRGTLGTELRQLRIAAGGGTVTAEGRLATTGSAIRARANLPDLAVLGAGYGGGLSADLTLDGTTEAGRLTLAGQGRDLTVGDRRADGMLAGESALDIALTVAGNRVTVERGQVTTPQADARLTGTYDPAGSDLALAARIPSLAVAGPGFRGTLDATARFTGTPGEGTVVLDGTARDLAIGQPEADRLLSGSSTLALSLGVSDRRLVIDEARLTNPQITASATGTLTEDRRRIDLDARLANLALLIPEFPGPLTLTGDLTDDGQGYAVDLRAQGPGQIDATATGRLAQNFRTADLSIKGTAQAALANPFLGERAVSGGLSFALALNGPVGLASLSGPVRLTGGRLSDPALPVSLTDIAATATLSGGTAQVQATSGVSSRGQIAVTGSVGLTRPYPGDLAVTLTGLRLRDPELYTTTIDGTLQVTGPLTAGPLVAGRLALDETEVRIPSTLGTTGGLIADLRHVNEPAAVRATRARAGLIGAAATARGTSGSARLDITIAAPSRVFLRGRGLDAELGGEVRLTGPVTAIQPAGGFDLIRGRLDILGRRLTLSRATLTFEGDLIPTLDVAASTTGDGVTALVVVEGRADAPVVRFTSSPDLPEEEVLAQLLFGRGIDNISAFQAAQLAGAVATLAGRGGDGIVGRLRKGFGLDDLDLRTDAAGQTTFKAGKYLSEKLYSEVEVAPDGRSEINLNLDVRPGVTVRGSVGSEGGAGIGVFLERDY